MRTDRLTPDAEETPQSAHQMVLVVTVDGTISEVLQAPDEAHDTTPKDLLGNSIELIWSANLANQFKQLIKRTIRSRQVQCVEFKHGSGSGQFESIFVPQGRDRALMLVRDVSARRNEIEKMQKLAYVDEATKLPNREYLLDELRSCTERLRLSEGRAAVICFEIDQIDAHGNTFGSRDLDTILKELAARFIHGLRGANQSDNLDEERFSIAARIDFRRFGVVLPCIESGSDAEGVAERLSDAIQQPIKIGTRKLSVVARAGIALFPQDGTDANTLFENGIVAMEDAWNGQAADIKFHSGTVKMRALQRQDVEHEIRSALERDEFVLHFLPIVDARSNKTIAVEALLRWPQTVLGSQPIQKIVSIAEHTGLILPLGRWVLRRSCEHLRHWHDSGHESLRVAINLSAQEFSQPDLAQQVATVLQEYSIDPAFLDVEINEYMLFRDAMKEYATCSALKELGVGVVVDDYGTGACSLAHVSRSPIDAIKIDNSFVTHSETIDADRSACAALTAMAHKLGIKVIAEGVETNNQADLLRSFDCDYLQGFLFSEPCPADELSNYLENAAATVEAD